MDVWTDTRKLLFSECYNIGDVAKNARFESKDCKGSQSFFFFFKLFLLMLFRLGMTSL